MQVLNQKLALDNNKPVRFVASPNHGGLIKEEVFVIIHYTEGQSFEAAVTWLTKTVSQVSSHLVIGRKGEIAQLLPFNTIGWHAGISTWENYNNLNSFSIGIELDNAGMMKRVKNTWVSSFGKAYPDSDVLVATHKFNPKKVCGWHKFTDIQLQTTRDIIAALIIKYGIRKILGHDDIAPKRKWDPGPAFPMEQFRKDVAEKVIEMAGSPPATPPATTPPAVPPVPPASPPGTLVG